jgi:transcriptional regulator with XRE-family HTH domain
MSEATKTIGEFFKKHRQLIGVRLDAAAEYLGITTETADGYESGRVHIPLSHVFSLVNRYNIAPDEVVAMFYRLAICPEVSALVTL